MKYLYDANLLTALTHEDHADHRRAATWLKTNAVRSWATCEITQTALIRLSANPHVISEPHDPVTTWRNLEIAMARSDHQILTLPPNGSVILQSCLAKCQGYRQTTDAHLIAIAIANGARLATFDTKLRHLSPDADAVEVVPLL